MGQNVNLVMFTKPNSCICCTSDCKMSKHVPKDRTIKHMASCILLVFLSVSVRKHHDMINPLNIASNVINTCSPTAAASPFDANYNHHSCLKMVPIILYTAASRHRHAHPHTTAMLPAPRYPHHAFITPLVTTLKPRRYVGTHRRALFTRRRVSGCLNAGSSPDLSQHRLF